METSRASNGWGLINAIGTMARFGGPVGLRLLRGAHRGFCMHLAGAVDCRSVIALFEVVGWSWEIGAQGFGNGKLQGKTWRRTSRIMGYEEILFAS